MAKKNGPRADFPLLPIGGLGTEKLHRNLLSLSKRFSEAAREIQEADISDFFYQKVLPDGFRVAKSVPGEGHLPSETAASTSLDLSFADRSQEDSRSIQCPPSTIHWLAGDDTEGRSAGAIQEEFSKRLKEPKARLYLLAGFGTGRALRAMNEEIGVNNVGLLILEPDSALFRAVLSLADYQDLLEYGKFYYAVGNTMIAQAEKLLDRYRLFTTSELCLFFHETEVSSEVRNRFIGWVQDIDRRKKHIERRYNLRVVEYLNRPRRISADTIRKVWIRELSANSAEYSRVQRHIVKAFAQVIQESGCEVVIPEHEDNAYFPPFYEAHHLMETDPDLALIINGFSTDSVVFGRPFSELLKIPKVSWFVDTPLTSFGSLKEYGLAQGDILTSTDAHWFEHVRQANPTVAERPVYTLPLAATYREKGPLDPAWECPVSYVGQIRDQSNIFESPKLPKHVRRILQQIVQAVYQAGRGRLVEDIVESSPELAELRRKYDLSEFVRSYYLQLIWEANSRFREETLLPLADLGLRIYGNEDWAKRNRGKPLEACYTGRTVAHCDLPRLFRNSRINVNMHHLQSSTSLNQRVFDVPAAGGFLITDYMEGIEELFEIGKEIVVYRTLDELRRKVEYYLAHPDERQAIAEQGHARVMRDHTFTNRWQTVLGILRKEGWV